MKKLVGQLLFLLFVLPMFSQVGINNTSPASGSMLDVTASDKGFLPPRISLDDINDNTTIQPSNTTGMLVYNTNESGTTSTDVTPGYYYWDGHDMIWKRFMTEGYSIKYSQTAQVRASSDNTVYTILTGLDNTLTAPVTGLYQIMATAYYAVEQPSGGNFRQAVNSSNVSQDIYTYQRNNSAGQGSFRLIQGSSTVLDEKYVASYAMQFPDGQAFWAHGQSVLMLVNVELEAGTSYRFRIEGREWTRYKSTTQGIFGWGTSSHVGSNGVSDAQYGDMTITLIKQY